MSLGEDEMICKGMCILVVFLLLGRKYELKY
jgi:hypothetical protein